MSAEMPKDLVDSTLGAHFDEDYSFILPSHQDLEESLLLDDEELCRMVMDLEEEAEEGLGVVHSTPTPPTPPQPTKSLSRKRKQDRPKSLRTLLAQPKRTKSAGNGKKTAAAATESKPSQEEEDRKLARVWGSGAQRLDAGEKQSLVEWGRLLADRKRLGAEDFFKRVSVVVKSLAASLIARAVRQHCADALAVEESGASGGGGNESALSAYRDLLLNAREICSEELLEKITRLAEKKMGRKLSADEKRQCLTRETTVILQSLSPSIAVKLAPVLKAHLNQTFNSDLDKILATVDLPDVCPVRRCAAYCRMLNTLLFRSKDKVSFVTTSPGLLGKLQPEHVFLLTFFAFVTCKRVKSDNLLQLAVTGRSSVGKSTLFENVLMETSHQLLTSSTSRASDGGGVGR